MMTEGMLLKKKKATKWLEQEMFNVKMVKRRERQFIKMEVKRWKGMFNNKTKIQKVSQKIFRTLLNYRVFIKICVFSLKFCDFSELCQFCCSAGFLPAWCVYTH